MLIVEFLNCIITQLLVMFLYIVCVFLCIDCCGENVTIHVLHRFTQLIVIVIIIIIVA